VLSTPVRGLRWPASRRDFAHQPLTRNGWKRSLGVACGDNDDDNDNDNEDEDAMLLAQSNSSTALP
jgi:hypothetical protein